jgi:RNA-dependent RNA polymerase
MLSVFKQIQTDLLGYISHQLLRIADVKDPGCPECLQLAEAASHAVDFPKTGTPVNFKTLPRAPGEKKPDFLAPESADVSNSDRYYPSEKLLGVLYRDVPTERRPPPLAPGISPSDGSEIYHALRRIDLFDLGLPSLEIPSDILMEEMESLLHSYYIEHLVSIAKTHTISKNPDAILSEEEVISGTILAKWPDHRKRRDAEIAMNLQVINFSHYRLITYIIRRLTS